MNFKKMTKQIKIFINFFILSLFILTFFPFSAQAIGLVTQPVNIENALRGSEYEETLIIVNTESKISKIGLLAEGQIANWVKFYEIDEYDTTIEEIDIPPREKKNVTAIIIVPDDTPNGEYKGTVSAVTKPVKDESIKESYSSVIQKIDREVTIKVTDEEVINLAVSIIPKSYDLKIGETLDIRFIYDNQSNISLSPQIDLKITKDQQTISNVIYPYPEEESPVKSNSLFEIPVIKIATQGFEQGKYLVDMKFLHKGVVILEKDFRFSISNESTEVMGWADRYKNMDWGKTIYIGLYILIALFLLIAIIFYYKSHKIKKDTNK